MKKYWANKVVWITGGGSGIGEALAVEFAAGGADVVVSGRRAEKLAGTVQKIEKLGRRGAAVAIDVTDDNAVKNAVAEIIEKFGRLDVTVANAGMGVMGNFETLSDEVWKQQMGVNLFGAINTARHALPELKKTGGRMVFIGSVMGLLTTPGGAAYASSKFAVRAISLTISQELAREKASCTVIHPGFVASDISKVDNHGVYHDDYKEKRPAALIWPTPKAAKVMVRAIKKRKIEYVFTGHGKIGAFLGMHFPRLIHFAVSRSAGK